MCLTFSGAFKYRASDSLFIVYIQEGLLYVINIYLIGSTYRGLCPLNIIDKDSSYSMLSLSMIYTVKPLLSDRSKEMSKVVF